MPAGLQVWDANGALILDTSTRVGTLIGSVNTGAVNGAIAVSLIGEPLFVVKQLSFPLYTVYIFPNVSIAGGVLSWVYPPPFNPYQANVAVRIFYGFY